MSFGLLITIMLIDNIRKKMRGQSRVRFRNCMSFGLLIMIMLGQARVRLLNA